MGGTVASMSGPLDGFDPRTIHPVALVVGGIIVAVGIGSAVSDGDGGAPTPSVAFCTELEEGARAEQLWNGSGDQQDHADRAYGYISISCPEELERHRSYFDGWDIDIDA